MTKGATMTGAPHPLRCEPRTEVRLFAEAMERTLRKHDHKGGWDEMSLGDILERIRGELKEAETVWNTVKTREDYEQVSKELIDVANFCMMFYDNLHPELYHTLHNSATTSAENYFCAAKEDARYFCKRLPASKECGNCEELRQR